MHTHTHTYMHIDMHIPTYLDNNRKVLSVNFLTLTYVAY